MNQFALPPGALPRGLFALLRLWWALRREDRRRRRIHRKILQHFKDMPPYVFPKLDGGNVGHPRPPYDIGQL